MNTKKIIAVLLIFSLALALTACGKQTNPDNSTVEKTLKSAEKSADELKSEIDTLVAQENAILDEERALWEKVFSSMGEVADETVQDGNYGDYLLKCIEAAKEQFTEDELKTLKAGAEKIRNIEEQVRPLIDQYMEFDKDQKDDEDADSTFPAFEGTDFDGNKVRSDDLFSGNAVTVVNLWFTTCSPCVNELGELNALNQELSEKGGEVIGINAFTLDGDKSAIQDAKDVFSAKGASYRNIYFDTDSEAGALASGITAFPTTYVIDRQGYIVGDPIVGAINTEAGSKMLRAQIDEALARDEVIPYSDAAAG